MDVLNVKNLNLFFETESGLKQALYDISFSLKRGQVHSLVGESGCGKTISALSILQLLPKTAKITSGEIIFNQSDFQKQQNLLKIKPKEFETIRGAKIALIPQDPLTSLNPLYTIGNQLLEVIQKHQNLKGKEALKKAIEALEAVQIPCAEEKLKAYPHEFSGGMKQRAIIAMALACNAEIIIADEPTTALDVTIQAQIMNILADIKKELGTSILLITHDLGLVKDFADEISVMYAGRIVENAMKKDFFEHTNHPYSRALLKSLPSNKREKLFIIEGQPPSIHTQIQGCKFHPRCEFAMPICSKEVPLLKSIAENHLSACHLN